MNQGEETPRACNSRFCASGNEGLWNVSGASVSAIIPDPQENCKLIDDSPLKNLGVNFEKKENANDEGRGFESGCATDYPQCRFTNTSMDTESKSLSTSTSIIDTTSDLQFRNDISLCRFVQVRHKNERHLIALPVCGKSPSSSIDSLRRREDIASTLGAAFHIPSQYRVVGLIGPFFDARSREFKKENKEASVVLPLTILDHPEATFIDRYYHENISADEGAARHEFELLLYPHPIQDDEDEKSNASLEQRSEANKSDSTKARYPLSLENDQYSIPSYDSEVTYGQDDEEARVVYMRLGRFLAGFIGEQMHCNKLSPFQGSILLQQLVPFPQLCKDQHEVNQDQLSRISLPYEAYNVDVVFQGAYQVAKWTQSPSYLVDVLKLIADNLSREMTLTANVSFEKEDNEGICKSQLKAPFISSQCYEMNHLDQGDMIDIVQVLLECEDIELPGYMALVDAILKKKQVVSRVYHDHLVRMKQQWRPGASSYPVNESSQSQKMSIPAFNNDTGNEYSDKVRCSDEKSLDMIMGDIRALARFLDPIFQVAEDISDTEENSDFDNTVLDSYAWSKESESERIQNITSNDLISDTARLVDQGRISLEIAMELVSTFARSSNKDCTQFLHMLEYLAQDGEGGDTVHKLNNLLESSKQENKERSVESQCTEESITFNSQRMPECLVNHNDESLASRSNEDEASYKRNYDHQGATETPNLPDWRYTALFEEVGKWDDFGPLEMATLQICIAQEHPELKAASSKFHDFLQRGRMELRKTVQKCVNESIEHQIRERILSTYNAFNAAEQSDFSPKPDEVRYPEKAPLLFESLAFFYFNKSVCNLFCTVVYFLTILKGF